jgi:hypothetical protein
MKRRRRLLLLGLALVALPAVVAAVGAWGGSSGTPPLTILRRTLARALPFLGE